MTREEREIIARLRNCILALVQQRVMLFDTSIQYTYDASLKYEVRGHHLVGPSLTLYQATLCCLPLLHTQSTQTFLHL